MKRAASLDWREAWEVVAREDGEYEEASIGRQCPLCESSDSVREDPSSFRVGCLECGAVLEVITDDRPEWTTRQEVRMFSKDPARGDAINPLMPHASMHVDIIPGTRLPYRQYKMIKLNRWGALSPMERSLCVVFDKIETACNRARVPNQVNYTTKAFFRRVYASNMKKQSKGGKREGLRGQKRDGLIAYCNYMAFKACELYWSKARVGGIYDIPASEVRRGGVIFWELLKDVQMTSKLVKITGVKQYLNWFSVELGVSRAVCTFACALFKLLKAEGIGTSKQPQSIAAGCLWCVCRELCPQIDIEDVVRATGKSKATINDVEKLMDGAEREALVAIFADEVCALNEVDNALTQQKTRAVAVALTRIDAIDELELANDGRKLWTVGAFAVYFVLSINDIMMSESAFFQHSYISPEVTLQLARIVLPYRDFIVTSYIGDVHRSGLFCRSGGDNYPFHATPFGSGW